MNDYHVTVIAVVRVEGAESHAAAMETGERAVGKLFDADRRVSAVKATVFDAERVS